MTFDDKSIFQNDKFMKLHQKAGWWDKHFKNDQLTKCPVGKMTSWHTGMPMKHSFGEMTYWRRASCQNGQTPRGNPEYWFHTSSYLSPPNNNNNNKKSKLSLAPLILNRVAWQLAVEIALSCGLFYKSFTIVRYESPMLLNFLRP